MYDEDVKPKNTPESKYSFWIKQLDEEAKVHRDFRENGKAVMSRYKDERKRLSAKFNILWSNTEVMHAAVYAQPPKPDIRRRFRDADPVARETSKLMERAVSYAIDQFDFDACADSAIDDFLLAGLGTARVRYIPYIETGEAPKQYVEERREVTEFDALLGEDVYESRYFLGEEPVETSQVEVDEVGPFVYGEPDEEVVYEEVRLEPIPWNRFRWQPCDNWNNCDWVGIESYLDKRELREQFPNDADGIPLGYTAECEASEDQTKRSRALLIEIFDKKERKICVLAPGYPKILKSVDDPLELEDFYPVVPPMMGTTTSDTLMPIADFMFYRDQADELDLITDRIHKLTHQLKYRGVYDAVLKQLGDVADSDDGDFIPVDNLLERYGGSQGLESAIKAMPLAEIVTILTHLYRAREEVKQTIYEITGIADIMRGSTAASETLGAQQLKTQFGSMRQRRRQREVEGFMRSVVRLMAEVMVEQFEPSTLEMMTGVPVDQEMMSLMRDDLLRSYKIDIETDSTIAGDQMQERQDRTELLTAVTGFLKEIMPLVQAGLPMEVAKELLMFGLRSFKDGRQVEDVLNQIGQGGGVQEEGVPTQEQPLPGEAQPGVPPEVAQQIAMGGGMQ